MLGEDAQESADNGCGSSLDEADAAQRTVNKNCIPFVEAQLLERCDKLVQVHEISLTIMGLRN